MAKSILGMICLVLVSLGVYSVIYGDTSAGVCLLAGFTFVGLILAAAFSDENK